MPNPPCIARTHFKATERRCNKANFFYQCRHCMAAARRAEIEGSQPIDVKDIRARQSYFEVHLSSCKYAPWWAIPGSPGFRTYSEDATRASSNLPPAVDQSEIRNGEEEREVSNVETPHSRAFARTTTPEDEEVDTIIGELRGESDQGDDPNKAEEKLRKLLNTYHAKVLHKVCTKLSLKPQGLNYTREHMAGYVNLLCGYYRARVEAVTAALKRPGVIATENRATRHCSFRLLNVIFSDDFVARMGEVAKTPSRQELDIRTVNEDSQYWVDVAEAYNNDKQHYNGFALGPKAQYIGVDPALAIPHTRSNLKGLWETVVRRYDSALAMSKRSRSNAAFWEYCGGHVDALYMDDWLQIREDCRENVVWLLPQTARMSTFSAHRGASAERPSYDSSDEAGSKRRRLSAVDRFLEFMREDREAEMAERQREERYRRQQEQDERDRRQRESEEARGGGNCAVLDRFSVSVQRAMATLQVLKQGHANQEHIGVAELELNKLILSWTQAMANASSDLH